jgi:hypothetical protein
MIQILSFFSLLIGFCHSSIVINEIFAYDTANATFDWLEIYNTAPNVVSLTGFSLTDDDSREDSYNFPTDASIDAHGFLVIAFLPTNQTGRVSRFDCGVN